MKKQTKPSKKVYLSGKTKSDPKKKKIPGGIREAHEFEVREPYTNNPRDCD